MRLYGFLIPLDLDRDRRGFREILYDEGVELFRAIAISELYGTQALTEIARFHAYAIPLKKTHAQRPGFSQLEQRSQW